MDAFADPPIELDLGDQPPILFEFLTRVGVDYLTAAGTLPRARLEMAHEIAGAALQGIEAPCRLVFTLELKDSIDRRAGTTDYTIERGNGMVNARAMALPDGGYDIITGAEWLVELDESTNEVANLRSRMFAHTMGHEAQHVRMMHADSETLTYQSRADLTATEHHVLPAMAINIDEYRAEVAANRIARSNGREDDLGDHLAYFRAEMNASRAEMATDIAVGGRRAATACNDLWKALAYVFAERADEEDDIAAIPPSPVPPDWAYLADIWPVLVQIYRLVPAANEDADGDLMVTALELLCRAFVIWIEAIGFAMPVDDDGTISCYWFRDEY